MTIKRLNKRLSAFAIAAAMLIVPFGPAVAAGNQHQLTFAMVTHAQNGDTFWDYEYKGGKQAAKDLGVKLIYANSPRTQVQVSDVKNVIQQHVDGIAVTLAHPYAMKPVIKQAVDAGIPVVGFNSGISYWKKTDLSMFIGQNPNIAGQAFGKRLNQAGAKHVLCIDHGKGNKALARRCAGIKQTFNGNYSLLYVNGESMPSVRSRVLAKLQQDPSIDYVAFTGAPYAMTVVRALNQVGHKVHITTFDLNKPALKAIQEGKIEWAVDQQPYLQGYLSVVALYLKATNDNTIGGGRAVLTGPSFVTQQNADRVAKYVKQGTRG